MLFGLITFLTAITISSVAIYYSVAGLVAIFAAAAVPIIIMGTSLEVGKLVTAVWLHKNWKKAPLFLKTYLSIAVVVLMLITSMGIFGFLSKAHVDQNLSSDTVTQRIEIIDNKIKAENSYIVRQKDVLTRLSGQDKGNESRFNQDIQIEQKKIDDAYKRLEVLDADVKAYTDQGTGFFKGDNVKRGLEVRKCQQPERDRINQQITTAQENINKLRAQINSTLASNTVEIKAIEKNIFDAQGRIEQLVIEQEPLKGQLMKLESEVGPIRYIAEFVYGEKADRNLLEEAVRWVIITIIFVFDPLAVLLLIASQYTFRWRYIQIHGEEPTAPTTPPAPKTPSTPPAPKPTGGQSLSKIVEKQKEVQIKSKPIKLSSIAEKKEVKTKPSPEVQIKELVKEEPVDYKQVEEEIKTSLKTIDNNKNIYDSGTLISQIEAKQSRMSMYEAKINEDWKQKQNQWLLDNPTETIDHHKRLYINGQIDTLPWENIELVKEEPPMPLDQWNKMIEEAEKEVSKEIDPKKKTSAYIMREENQQVKKETQAE